MPLIAGLRFAEHPAVVLEQCDDEKRIKFIERRGRVQGVTAPPAKRIIQTAHGVTPEITDMRKIVASEFISVDGMISDPGDRMEWVTSIFNDKESAYQNDLYDRVDTMLLGRTTYGILGGYWPNAASNGASNDDLELSKKINRAKHVVVAHQPVTFLWENTVQLRELTHDGIVALKQQLGKDIVIVGSATIVQQLASLGLIDEYHLLVHPVVMGKGKPLFKNGDRPLPLQVIGTEEFGNGVTLVRYRALLDATSTANSGRSSKPLAPALGASGPGATGQPRIA